MTDQPNPETTDSTLDEAERAAAREAAQQAGGDPALSGSTGETPPMTDVAASAEATEPPKVIRATARTSQPVSRAPNSAPSQGQAGAAGRSPHPANGSGNGSHRDVHQSSPDIIRAETVSVHQGNVQTVNAGSMDVRQGAVARVAARDVTVTGGAIGFARADRVSVELGATGAAVAGEAHVTQSAVNSVIAREAHIEQSLVQTVIGATVRFERPSAVVFLMARRVEGEVRAILDWRGALVFGVAAGAVISIFRRRR